jgi:DNA-binding PucR family transcriptional regulator
LPRVEDVLRDRGVTSAWRVGAELQEGVVALRRDAGLPRLLDEIARFAVARVGLSAVFGTLEGAASALREARLACAAASAHSTEPVRFDEHPLAVLLAATPDAAAALARRVLGRVLEVADSDRAHLLGTMRVWLAEAGSTSAAARRLHVHRNTVRYRLRRLEELTGRDLTAPIDVAEMHVALEASRVLSLA